MNTTTIVLLLKNIFFTALAIERSLLYNVAHGKNLFWQWLAS